MKHVQPDLFAPPQRATPHHCKTCGICDPLPAGLTWAKPNLCSDCAGDARPRIARAAYQTEPCPVKGCTGWRHPLATMCDGCKTLIPHELHLQLMRSAAIERRPELVARYGALDRTAVQRRAIEEAAKARGARR